MAKYNIHQVYQEYLEKQANRLYDIVYNKGIGCKDKESACNECINFEQCSIEADDIIVNYHALCKIEKKLNK